MAILDGLTFKKALPVVAKAKRESKTPLQRGKERLTSEIDIQISLAGNPKFKIIKETKKRGTGKVTKTQRIPRSWVTVDDDTAYITPRFANKPLNVGGKKGSYITCAVKDVGKSLATLNKWVASDESNDILEKALKAARRKKK